MNAHRASPSKPRPTPLKRKRRVPPSEQRILLLLIALRTLNALTVRTFFQPDEYYQSLEPAWRFVFGYGELTWEWREGIRGFLYPSVFASVWWIADVLGVREPNVLIALPYLVQAVFAALCDFWTYRLARRLFGNNVAKWALFCSVTSLWNWFALTRTFSNSLETTLTAGALLYWPWPSLSHLPETNYSSNISISLVLASIAVLLRPTSIITFILLLPFSLSSNLLLHAIIIGPTALACTVVLDTLYFRRPTFPAWNFLRFNFLDDLSVFYGRMAPHYYLTQGLPMILTTYLPFSLHGLSFFPFSVYTWVVGGVILAFSAIEHKEARFISPLSPLLLVFAGYALARIKRRRLNWILPVILLLNAGVGYYATRVHQAGVIGVMHFLRKDIPVNGSVGFLMPCYSTPWQTFLQRPDVDAWKLSCDPPLTLPREERETYLDEADLFYEDPEEFIRGIVSLPQRLVFFDSLTPKLGGIRERYRECARFFNSRFHDDWRRKGDVIVWCLQEGSS